MTPHGATWVASFRHTLGAGVALPIHALDEQSAAALARALNPPPGAVPAPVRQTAACGKHLAPSEEWCRAAHLLDDPAYELCAACLLALDGRPVAPVIQLDPRRPGPEQQPLWSDNPRRGAPRRRGRHRSTRGETP